MFRIFLSSLFIASCTLAYDDIQEDILFEAAKTQAHAIIVHIEKEGKDVDESTIEKAMKALDEGVIYKPKSGNFKYVYYPITVAIALSPITLSCSYIFMHMHDIIRYFTLAGLSFERDPNTALILTLYDIVAYSLYAGLSYGFYHAYKEQKEVKNAYENFLLKLKDEENPKLKVRLDALSKNIVLYLRYESPLNDDLLIKHENELAQLKEPNACMSFFKKLQDINIKSLMRTKRQSLIGY